MNPASTTETNFALEGFLPLPLLGALGLSLLLLSVWFARRDARHADRPGLVWGLLVLRVGAVLVLLWMLAGPTRVAIHRSFRPKNVAILVDRSASMGLVDALDGSGNVSRWAAARDLGPAAAAIGGLDQALGTLRSSWNELRRFGQLPDSRGDAAAARADLARVARGFREGVRQAGDAADRLGGAAEETRRGIDEALRSLTDRPLVQLDERVAEFQRGKTLAALDRPAWLPDLLAALGGPVTRLEQLAAEWVRQREQPAAQSATGFALEESKLSRWDKVSTFLAAAETGWLGEIRRTAAVQRYEFGDKVVPLGATPWAARADDAAARPVLSASTQLGSAVQQVALEKSARPVEAAILITDGGQNAGRDPREVAPSLAGTAVYVVPIGNTKMQRDVILHHTHAPQAVLRNDQVVFDSIVTAYDCDREKLRVELLENDAVVGQQTLEVQGAVFDQRVELRWKAAALGKHRFALRVVPVAEERTEANNATRTDVQVMEDHIRVLVADHFPRWETRYLINLFKRDERVTFDQLLFEPQRSSGKGTLADFPSTLEEWSRYRVVILGDVQPSHLTPERQKLLREYVTETGGNLILVAGREAMPAAYRDQPLGALLPVEPGERTLPPNTPYFLHLADEGSATLATQVAETPLASERVWREMAERLPIHGLSEFSRPKRSAHSLLWASPRKTGFSAGDPATRTFLAWQYVGAGRVVALAAPVTYQLRYRQGDQYHHRFWGQLLRWAVARDLAEGSQTVRLSTDKSRYEEGESVEVSVRLSRADGRAVGGGEVHVGAYQEGKLVQDLTVAEDPTRPGSYHGAFENLPAGPVRLEVTGDRVKALLAEEGFRRPVEATVTVDPNGRLELRHPLCNVALLRETADAAGGVVIPPTALGAALRALNLEPEILEETSKMPLWNRWDLFWIFIACLSLEWAGRKYLGLS
jgi:hypothetical protein